MGVAMGMGDPAALTPEVVVNNIFSLKKECNGRGLAAFGVTMDRIGEQFITEVVEEYSSTCNPREIRREDVIPFVKACL